MEAHYFRRNCLCLLFPLLHLPPLQTLQSVLCFCYFFMMVLTPVDSSLLCICYLPRSFCDTVLLTSYWAFKALLFMPLLLLLILLHLPFFWKNLSFFLLLYHWYSRGFHSGSHLPSTWPPSSKLGNSLYIGWANQHRRRQRYPTPVLLPGKSHGWRSLVGCRVGHDWATSLFTFTFMHWRRKWQPTPVFLPGESQGQRSLLAAVYGVAQSRTRLKRLSSSSSSSQPTSIYWCVHYLPSALKI